MMEAALTFLASLPRSGSTVLTRMLAARHDVLCLPESFFPHLLDHLSPREWRDRRWLAALFVASCSDGSPLELAEAEECFSRDKGESLARLAAAVCRKEGRDPREVRAVVWKATRLIGSIRTAMELGGRFVILHRPAVNVFESQFRVPFGLHNHNPQRFALFAASYAAAFRRYPAGRTLELEYADIPARLGELFGWVGSRSEQAAAVAASLDATAGRRAWHAGIQAEFRNDDAAKAAALDPLLRSRLESALAVVRRVGFLGALARAAADRRQVAALRAQATALLARPARPDPS
jgi:hypothetical protein